MAKNKKQKAKTKKLENELPSETNDFTKNESKPVTSTMSKMVQKKSAESTKDIGKVSNRITNLVVVDDNWISPVQNLLLRLISAVYLVAFFSFYYQIRGNFNFKSLKFAN